MHKTARNSERGQALVIIVVGEGVIKRLFKGAAGRKS